MKTEQRDPFDDRVLCIECIYLAGGRRCRNWRAARLDTPEVFPIKALPQRCPGHQPAHRFKTEPQTEDRPTPTEPQTEPTNQPF
jgi:hypothetical protein